MRLRTAVCVLAVATLATCSPSDSKVVGGPGGQGTEPPVEGFDTSTVERDAGARDPFEGPDDGDWRWVQRVESTEEIYPVAADTFTDDEAVLAGNLSGVARIGTDSVVSRGDESVFLARIRPSGTYQFIETFGRSGSTGAADVAVYREEAIALAGSFDGRVDFGGGEFEAAQLADAPGLETDGYLAVFSALGVHRWSIQLGGQPADGAEAVDFARDGSVYVAGTFAGDATLGSQEYGATGPNDGYVAKFRDDGTPLWGVILSGTGVETPGGLAVDSDGTVWIAGNFSNEMEAGTRTVTAPRQEAMFLARINPDGEVEWAEAFGRGASPIVEDLVVVDGSDVVVGGSFEHEFVLDGVRHQSRGGRDGFTARFRRAEGFSWSRQVGTFEDDSVNGLAAWDERNRVLAAGVMTEPVDFGLGTTSFYGEEDAFYVEYDAFGNTKSSWSYGAQYEDAGQAVAIQAAGEPLTAGLFRLRPEQVGGDRQMFLLSGRRTADGGPADPPPVDTGSPDTGSADDASF